MNLASDQVAHSWLTHTEKLRGAGLGQFMKLDGPGAIGAGM
jgi:hypothetical protein